MISEIDGVIYARLNLRMLIIQFIFCEARIQRHQRPDEHIAVQASSFFPQGYLCFWRRRVTSTCLLADERHDVGSLVSTCPRG